MLAYGVLYSSNGRLWHSYREANSTQDKVIRSFPVNKTLLAQPLRHWASFFLSHSFFFLSLTRSLIALFELARLWEGFGDVQLSGCRGNRRSLSDSYGRKRQAVSGLS